MKAIMVVGTTSHAGKSFLTTAICRILNRKGWQVTPFKGQNMALNAYVTDQGGEIGHAQAVQAWAAGTTPQVAMNPVLLKPQGNMTSQVIMKGQAIGVTGASEYYEKYFERGWQAIAESLNYLQENFQVIVCEGAGSPAEINLKHRDLTNMRVATYLQAATILIVDIDRGGAFAHVVGTLALLEPNERALIKGIVINKFRGQRSLLDSGIEWLENYTGIPVLGVIPWSELLFPAEDSLSLLDRRTSSSQSDLTIAIIRLPRIANFNDFDPLEAESSLTLKYVNLTDNLGYPDAVILPGSKTTISDLIALHESGMAEQLQKYAKAGGVIFGVCGGYQMLGEEVNDPDHYEGISDRYDGLKLLPISTQICPEKVAQQRQSTSYFPQAGLPIIGYEIHQGITQFIELDETHKKQSYQSICEDSDLGIVNKSQSIWGTYLHGIFDNGPWRRSWLNFLRKRRGLPTLPTGVPNYQEQREAMLNSLADLVDQYVDLTPIFASLNEVNEDS